MSDDVSLAGPAGGLSPAANATGGTVVWEPESPRLWQLYFAVVMLGVLTFVALTGSPESPADRWLAIGLLVAMSAWYVFVGRWVTRPPRPWWRAWLFHGVLLALFATAISAAGNVTFLLFALCPLVYMTVGLRPGHIVVACYAFAPAVMVGLTRDPGSLGEALTIGAIVLTVTVIYAKTTALAGRISEERAALIEELTATRDEVSRLSREAGVAQERQRLAGEIHDTVAQGLSSVVMLVQAADAELTRDPDRARAHLDLAARTARENLDEARAIVAALTPSLDQASLVDALRRLVVRVGEHAGAPEVVVPELAIVGDPRSLSTGAEVVLLRAAQESLTNARKHAGASEISLRLRFDPQAVVLETRDDGRGFDPAAPHAGYGLAAMRSRVEQFGGRLTISSAAGRGTTITTEITE